jgi:hypothetical protein
MVMMDLIDGPDAHQKFKYSNLPPTVLDDIQNALKKLHEAVLVFGDMRRPNIMLVNSRDAYDEDEDVCRGRMAWSTGRFQLVWTCRQSEVPNNAEWKDHVGVRD